LAQLRARERPSGPGSRAFCCRLTCADASLATASDESESVEAMREQMRAQRSELHALGARLHGLRLILSLSQQANSAPQQGIQALQQLLTVLTALSDPPPPPQGVPATTLEDMMPPQPYARARLLCTPERVPTECSVCLDALDGDQPVRLLRCGHIFHQHCIDHWFARCGPPVPWSSGVSRKRGPRLTRHMTLYARARAGQHSALAARDPSAEPPCRVTRVFRLVRAAVVHLQLHETLRRPSLRCGAQI
jgi:hypothetical protein